MKSIRYLLASLAALSVTVAAAAALATPAVPDSAFGEGAVDGDDPRVETRLLVDAEQVAAGETVRVGVLYTLDPDWHVYWRNSGDAGLSTDTEFSGKGLSFGPLQWPAPKVYVDQAGQVYTFGYSDQVLFLSEATVAADAAGSLSVEANVDYLACKVDCIPGQSTLTRTLPVGQTSQPAADEIVELFDAAAASLPVGADALGVGVEMVVSQRPIRPKDRFQAAIAVDFCAEERDGCEQREIAYEHRKYAFIPDDTFQADVEVIGVQQHPEREHAQVLKLEGSANSQAPRDDERLAGVVHIKDDDGPVGSLLIDAPFERGPPEAEVVPVDHPLLEGVDQAELASAADPAPAAPVAPEPIALWKALILAFFGGMILNLMPCVFPVLAIKVSSFTRLVHESKSSILSHGVAYTAGIVGSMLTLAMVVVGLRAAGTQVGWGFQFQEPLFIAALCAILVLFALNLFGVFEVSVSSTKLADRTQQAEGLRRSAGEGVLAVILATPCSAPFLGTAVGFALASSTATILAIFATLGLGLAAPFVVLTLAPGWARVLPKPGAWMNVLKMVLGVALLGTVVWLFWILHSMTGADGIVKMLIFLSTLAVGAWFFGKIQFRYSGAKKWGMTLLAAAVIGAVGAYVLEFERAAKTKRAAVEGEIDWQEWSDEAVQQELAKGRVVFVDFTADWCITCKANEHTIINTERVKAAIDDNDVTPFMADWTNPDERIRAKLAEHGKGGVPMYLVYYPDRPDQPRVLPEVLTVDLLVDALSQ